jgi:CheY-like chemotaxis protein
MSPDRAPDAPANETFGKHRVVQVSWSGNAAREHRAMDDPRNADVPPRPTEMALRILVVDDHERNRCVMQTMLAALGYSVSLVASGEEAVAQAAEQAFDLVVMDLHLLGASGDETTRRMRAACGSWDPFIVSWTTDLRHQFNGSLYDGQLPKPITCQAIVDVIARVRIRATARACVRGVVPARRCCASPP